MTLEYKRTHLCCKPHPVGDTADRIGLRAVRYTSFRPLYLSLVIYHRLISPMIKLKEFINAIFKHGTHCYLEVVADNLVSLSHKCLVTAAICASVLSLDGTCYKKQYYYFYATIFSWLLLLTRRSRL